MLGRQLPGSAVLGTSAVTVGPFALLSRAEPDQLDGGGLPCPASPPTWKCNARITWTWSFTLTYEPVGGERAAVAAAVWANSAAATRADACPPSIPSAAKPVEQVQHPVTPDDHVGVLQQVLAVNRPEVPLAGAERHRHDIHRHLVH